MSDPRIDPNYRGVKCKGCGEYLPFLFNRLCTHCALEAKDAEIERLKAELFTMRNVFHQQDAKIERLRAALERIANPRDGEGYGEDLREMAREALKDDL
jgi:hypothetical protein